MAQRHLIYHVCPLRDNDVWRANLEQLLKRIDLFDGLRVVAVAEDGGERLWPAQEVARLLTFHRCKLLRRRNDRRLREVATFRDLLLEVRDLPDDDAVFYAHTKGNSTADDPKGAEYWRNMMYHELLDGWRWCVDLLQAYEAVGTTRITWPKGHRPPYPTRLEHGNWMFAGTFFWFRAAVLRRPGALEVPADRYGAEAWLSGLLDVGEAKSVFQPWPEVAGKRDRAPNPYEPDVWLDTGHVIPDGQFDYPRTWQI